MGHISHQASPLTPQATTVYVFIYVYVNIYIRAGDTIYIYIFSITSLHQLGTTAFEYMSHFGASDICLYFRFWIS